MRSLPIRQQLLHDAAPQEPASDHRYSLVVGPPSDAEIYTYWHTGEPQDKAGAYAIQGLGAVFVERLEGSYSGVMGLPLYETAQLLKDFGIQVLAQHA